MRHRSKCYLCWQRSLAYAWGVVSFIKVSFNTPDACPAHAGEPPPCRLDIIFDIELVLAFLVLKWNCFPVA
jgi:hypothetical protein